MTSVPSGWALGADDQERRRIGVGDEVSDPQRAELGPRSPVRASISVTSAITESKVTMSLMTCRISVSADGLED